MVVANVTSHQSAPSCLSLSVSVAVCLPACLPACLSVCRSSRVQPGIMAKFAFLKGQDTVLYKIDSAGHNTPVRDDERMLVRTDRQAGRQPVRQTDRLTGIYTHVCCQSRLWVFLSNWLTVLSVCLAKFFGWSHLQETVLQWHADYAIRALGCGDVPNVSPCCSGGQTDRRTGEGQTDRQTYIQQPTQTAICCTLMYTNSVCHYHIFSLCLCVCVCVFRTPAGL